MNNVNVKYINIIQQKAFNRSYSNKIDLFKKETILVYLNWINCLIEHNYVQLFYYNCYIKIKNNYNYENYLISDLNYISQSNKLITIMHYIDQYDDNTHLIAVYFAIKEQDKEYFIKKGFDVSLFDILEQKPVNKIFTFPCTLQYKDKCLENLSLSKLDQNEKYIMKIIIENNFKPKIGLFLTVNNTFLNNILSKMNIEDYLKQKGGDSVMIKNNKIVILSLYNKLVNNKIQKEGIIFEKQNIIKNGLLMDFYLNNYIIYNE